MYAAKMYNSFGCNLVLLLFDASFPAFKVFTVPLMNAVKHEPKKIQVWDVHNLFVLIGCSIFQNIQSVYSAGSLCSKINKREQSLQ